MVAKRKYIFICRKCGRPHFSEEYDESRFCRNCGKFLSPQNISSRLTNEKNWEKEEILRWSKIHDDSYTWWIQQEKELGEKIRTRKELTKKDLVKVVEWKFDTLPGRKKRILSLITKNEDKKIRRISNLSLGSSNSDAYKVYTLCKIYGVGTSLASTILTFFDPENYGILDIHVWRELFGEDISQFNTQNYLKLLVKLRKIAKECNLNVRTVEKALFKKNIEKNN